MKISKHFLVAAVAIVLIIGVSIYISLGLTKTPQVNFVTVNKADITQAVKADGSVMAAQDLTLAFQEGGIVSEVDVAEGDTVKAGQALVKLNTSDSSAAVSQASAALAVAQANYDKVLNGATSDQINVSQAAVTSAQTALDNANAAVITTKAQQDTAVQNALNTLLNTPISAIPASGNTDSVIPAITGTYTGTQQGVYNISINSTGAGLNFEASGLENGSGYVRTSPVALGTKGLYIQFSATPSINDSWTVNIPNTYATGYVANLNAYQTALKTRDAQIEAAQAQVNSAQSALAQAQANLTMQQSSARPEDVAAAKAQVETAQAALQAAQSAYSKNILTAPIDGVVTLVNTKVGETVAGSTLAPGPAAIEMISSQKFQIQTYVSENDVAKIKVGDLAQVSLDAYGSGVNFDATVIAIDPAATMQNGVSSYKTTLQFNQDDPRVKAGMDANVLITDSTHTGVLVIPQTAIIQNNGGQFVLAQGSNGAVTRTQIQTGIVSVDGNVEVTSGLNEGQKIAAFGNQSN